VGVIPELVAAAVETPCVEFELEDIFSFFKVETSFSFKKWPEFQR
jgi:hypothetical protein